jgi:DNA-binding Lrp family transcriptional regulator
MDELDRNIIARLCGDLGDSIDPYGDLAAELGLPVDVLLARIRSYRDAGMLRRIGAILKHQNAGFTANGMSVWNVPDDQVERVGEIMARQPEVTHSYERPRLPDWPYNVFGMIHAHSEPEVRAIAARIAEEIGITDYDILFSIREFKKTSMVYGRSSIR